MTKRIDKTSDPKAEAGSKKMGFNHVPVSLFTGGSISMAGGVPKYGLKNWFTADEHKLTVYINGAFRHLLLLNAGEDYVRDTEGYVHHLEAIIGGCAVALDSILMAKCRDDRAKLDRASLDRYAAKICGDDYAKLPLKEPK